MYSHSHISHRITYQPRSFPAAPFTLFPALRFSILAAIMPCLVTHNQDIQPYALVLTLHHLPNYHYSCTSSGLFSFKYYDFSFHRVPFLLAIIFHHSDLFLQLGCSQLYLSYKYQSQQSVCISSSIATITNILKDIYLLLITKLLQDLKHQYIVIQVYFEDFANVISL